MQLKPLKNKHITPPKQVGINVGFGREPKVTTTAMALLSRNYKGIDNYGMTAVLVMIDDE